MRRVVAGRGRVVGPFRFPSEHLPSQLDNFGFESFNLLVLVSDLSFLLSLLLTALSDLGVQLADRRLQLLNMGFRLCLALDGTSMLGPPVVGLLTQFDPLQTVDVIRDARHATMVCKAGKRVQRPATPRPRQGTAEGHGICHKLVTAGI